MKRPDDATVSRRTYLEAVGASGVTGAAGLAGCSENAAATGTLAAAVADQPGDIAGCGSCVVTLDGLWLKRAEANLVQLQDGNTALIDEREVATREYEFLQLDVSSGDGTLADGGDVEVDTPGSAPLQCKEPFEVREDRRASFTAAFTPVSRGQANRYLLRPVASGVEVAYGDSGTGNAGGDEEGRSA